MFQKKFSQIFDGKLFRWNPAKLIFLNYHCNYDHISYFSGQMRLLGAEQSLNLINSYGPEIPAESDMQNFEVIYLNFA